MPDAGQLHVQFAERQKEREGILSARQTVCAPVVDSTEATKFFSIPFSCSKSCSVGNTTCIAPGCDQLLHMIQYRIRFWWKNQAFHELFRLIVQANTPCRLHGYTCSKHSMTPSTDRASQTNNTTPSVVANMSVISASPCAFSTLTTLA